MSEAHVTSYKAYWSAWLILLVITLGMIFLGNPVILIGGIIVKASIIALCFMHLRYENPWFTALILFSIFGFGIIMFGLLVPDGMAA